MRVEKCCLIFARIARVGECSEGSVGVNRCTSVIPEAKPSGREGCELLSFELPGGEAGVGIQNVCKSSGTPERALAVTDVQQFGTPKVSLARGLPVAARGKVCRKRGRRLLACEIFRKRRRSCFATCCAACS
jgi:hypothetical protein